MKDRERRLAKARYLLRIAQQEREAWVEFWGGCDPTGFYSHYDWEIERLGNKVRRLEVAA